MPRGPPWRGQRSGHDAPDDVTPELLQVSLNLAHRARLRVVGIATELAPGLSLPQQVPALVELLLELSTALCGVAALQRVLLVHQRLDPGQDVVVTRHGRQPPLRVRICPSAVTGRRA